MASWQTLTGELRVAMGKSRMAVPGGEAEIPAAHPSDMPVREGLPPFLGRCLIPSKSRTKSMLAGKSSTPQSTSIRHSGQRNSLRELKMFSRQRRQKVCWQGNTLAVVSSRSKHTEHSSRSRSDDSSILVYNAVVDFRRFFLIYIECCRDRPIHTGCSRTWGNSPDWSSVVCCFSHSCAKSEVTH